MKHIQEKKETVVAKWIEINEPEMFWHMDMTPKTFTKGKPWQNGNVERLFRTLFDEWLDFNNYQTPKDLSDILETFHNWFNDKKEIQKLDYKKPIQILIEKSN